MHKKFTPRKPSGTPSSLRKKKFTPKQYTPSGLNKNNDENNHMNTPLPFGGKMITFDSENIHPNNENRSRSISTTSSTNTPQRPRTPLSSRKSSTKSSKKKSTNKSNRTLKATSSFNNSILSDSLPSLDTMNINLINQNRPTSSPSAFRRSSSSSSSSSNRKSKNKSNRTPSPLGSETTISELDLGNSNVNTNENIDSNNYYEGKMNNDDYINNNNTNVKNNKGTKDENENGGNDGPPSPIPVRRRSSKRYMMQQEQKKTMKSVFINKQKLKGLTSSPADSTFSPISRQFLRRDDKRGIMKKTNIQRVIAERNKMNNNNQNHKFFESKINNGEMSKKEEDDESYITTTTTTTTTMIISSPMPQHRLKRSNNDKNINNNNTLHKTPRQLPSLLGGINKKNIINGGLGKYSSPSDMLLSPASKAFTTGTIGMNGKLQKGNVRKLIALKNHEGKNINNRGSSRLSNNVSTSALNKK